MMSTSTNIHGNTTTSEPSLPSVHSALRFSEWKRQANAGERRREPWLRLLRTSMKSLFPFNIIASAAPGSGVGTAAARPVSPPK